MSKVRKIACMIIVFLMLIGLQSKAFGYYEVSMSGIGYAAGSTVYKIGLNGIKFCGQHGAYLKTASVYDIISDSPITNVPKYLSYIFSFYSGTGTGYASTNILGENLKPFDNNDNYLDLQKILWDSSLNLGAKYNINSMTTENSNSSNTNDTTIYSFLEVPLGNLKTLLNKGITNQDKESLKQIREKLIELKDILESKIAMGNVDTAINDIIEYIGYLLNMDLDSNHENGDYYNVGGVNKYIADCIGSIKISIENAEKETIISPDDVLKETTARDRLVRMKTEGEFYEKYDEHKRQQLEEHGHIYTVMEKIIDPAVTEIIKEGNEQYYLIGEYQIQYLYSRIEKSVLADEKPILLSGITDIEVIDVDTNERINPDEITFITSQNYQAEDGNHDKGYVINAEGSAYPFPRNSEKFNIKIPYKEGSRSKIQVIVKFKYLDSVEASFNRVHLKAYDKDTLEAKDTDVQDLLEYKGSNYEWKTDQVDLTLPIPTPESKTWDFTIKKRDSETEEFLPGAVFKATITNLSTGEVIHDDYHTTDDDDGTILIKDLKARSGERDNFKVELEETKAPEGYVKTDKKRRIYVTIDDGKIVKSETSADLEEGEYVETDNTVTQEVEATLLNDSDQQDFVLQVIKIDENTQTGLKNATFTIELYDGEDHLIETYRNKKTDRNGKITINRKLDEGDYRVILKEESVPTGYYKRNYANSVEFSINRHHQIEEDSIVMKRQQTKTSSYKIVNDTTNYVEIENNRKSEYAKLSVYIDNYTKSPGKSYKEPYSIKIEKEKIDKTTGEDTGTLTEDRIAFTIELKQNGTTQKTWTGESATTKDGIITLSNLYYTGDVELWITEHLSDEQKKTYGVVGNETKVIKYHATSKTYGRTTYYYIDSIISGSNESNGVVVSEEKGTIVSGTSGIDSLKIGIKNTVGSGIDTTIKIAGIVFNDGAYVKDNKNGIFDGGNEEQSGDKLLPGIEVTLLDEEGNMVTKTANGGDLTNPVYTDDNGSYTFAKLDPMKRYRVKYTYNGQYYMATDYFKGTDYEPAADSYYSNISEGNTENENTWASYSKAKEQGRKELNDRFETINAYVNGNYIGKNGANTAYPKSEMVSEDDRSQQGVYDLVQRYNRGEDKSTKTLEEFLRENGVTDQSIKDLATEQQVELGDQNASYNTIMYSVNSKLQYIEDCKIEAVSDLYPNLDKFVVSDEEEEATLVTVDRENQTYTEGRVETIPPLYGMNNTGGTKQINFGIYDRPIIELQLEEDVYDMTVKINNKTTTYQYHENGLLNKLPVYEHDYEEGVTDNQGDYRTYEQETRESDYSESTENTYGDKALAIYVRYKIELKNAGAPPATIQSLINHYDSRYFAYDSTDENCFAYIGDENANKITEIVPEALNNNGDYTKYGADGKYQQLILPLNPAPSVQNGGETRYVYLSLKLRDASSTSSALRTLLQSGDKSERLRNYTEIYSYSTSANQSEEARGLVDRKSIAGNFMPGTGVNEFDNSNAPNMVFKKVAPRTLSGNAYEDTSVTDASKITTAKKKADSSPESVKDMKVELVELVDKGNNQYDEVVRATTYTDDTGNYKFDSYVPGDYVIRFTYGIKESGHDMITKVREDKPSSYNGQDYQSTYANPDTNKNQYWYAKTDVNLTRDDPTFADMGDDYSDAYDELNARQKAIEYATKTSMNGTSDIAINYYKAQVLKAGNVYNDDEALKQELANNTVMTAYTSKLELEVEKANRNQIYYNQIHETDGLTYDIGGIDFGLVRRAPSELTLEKRVSHIKITKSDNSILIDSDVNIDPVNGHMSLAQGGTDDANDMAKVHFINIDTPNANGALTARLEIDDEILVGSIYITYTFKVTNNSENTTITYYKGTDNSDIAIGYYATGNAYTGNETYDQLVYCEKKDHNSENPIDQILTHKNGMAEYKDYEDYETKPVETQALDIINYVSNNIQYESTNNEGNNWEVVTKNTAPTGNSGKYYDTLLRGDKNALLAQDTSNVDPTGIYNNIAPSVDTYNTILLTTPGNTLLVPMTKKDDTKECELTLSTRQTTDVDLDYTNIAEIIQTTNTVGRADASSIPGNLDPIQDYLSKYKDKNLNEFNSREYNEKGLVALDDNFASNPKQLYSNSGPTSGPTGKVIELDSAKAQQVSVGDPFGETYYYYVLAGSMLAIFAIGIACIKKFVLNKKI